MKAFRFRHGLMQSDATLAGTRAVPPDATAAARVPHATGDRMPNPAPLPNACKQEVEATPATMAVRAAGVYDAVAWPVDTCGGGFVDPNITSYDVAPGALQVSVGLVA